MKTSVDKILAILNRYGTSISHLAKIIGKDRRTVASWLDGSVQKELNLEIKTKICHFFRYPMNIWECDDKDFYINLAYCYKMLGDNKSAQKIIDSLK